MNIIPYIYRNPKHLESLTISDIDSVAIHHTGAYNTIQGDTDYHMNVKDYTWLAYGYYIDTDGTTYEVRGYEHINAGVAENNSHIVSIALRGNFDKSPPTLQQLESLRKLIQYLKKLIPGIKIVNGHNHWTKTTCPGAKFPLSNFIEGGVKVLKLRTISDNVKSLQEKLNKIGYSLVVDGVFGANTEKAVKDLQKQNNLKVDGIVGDNTSNFINDLISRMDGKLNQSLESKLQELKQQFGKAIDEIILSCK